MKPCCARNVVLKALLSFQFLSAGNPKRESQRKERVKENFRWREHLQSFLRSG